jgi:copper chaperone
MTEKTYTVTGMTCQHCVDAVTSEVSGVAGVESVRVDLGTGDVVVAGEGFTDDEVATAVDEAGYALV